MIRYSSAASFFFLETSQFHSGKVYAIAYGYVTPKFVILTAISCWFLLCFFVVPFFFHFVSLLCVLHHSSVFHFSFQFVNCCPRRDFVQKAKSRGTLVTCACIKESTYSWNIQSYSQYRKTLHLLEQGPRGMTFLLFAPASTKWLGWRKTQKAYNR